MEEPQFFNEMLLKSLNNIKQELDAKAAADKAEKSAAALPVLPAAAPGAKVETKAELKSQAK